MISEFVLDIVFRLVSGTFELLPDISWSVDTSAFQFLLSFLRCAAYLLPWNTVLAIISLIVSLSVFRIIIAVVKAVWDLLPFV